MIEEKKLSVQDVIDAIGGDDSELSELGDDSDFKSENQNSDVDDDGLSSSDHEPLANSVATDKNQQTVRWRRKDFEPSNYNFTCQCLTRLDTIKSPFQYFRQLISDDILDVFVLETNMYCLQKRERM
ncbi:hypothetical protein SNE40_010826 [Patella caerulea]|uniref:PiggyBac transposable element-derived protein domain-containing protein n=1 Tax=Patella caerulea TaxID=87958 RepID=A0AAN8JVU4_PATCE